MKTPKPLPPLSELYKRFNYNLESGILTHIHNCRFGKHLRGQVAGHVDKKGYLKTWAVDGEYLVHRLVYYMCTGEQPPVVDHINRITTDNRFVNLRASNLCWNAKNRKDVEHYPGIRVKNLKYRTRYSARITINNVEIYLGTFDTLELAITAKQHAEEKYHDKSGL